MLEGRQAGHSGVPGFDNSALAHVRWRDRSIMTAFRPGSWLGVSVIATQGLAPRRLQISSHLAIGYSAAQVAGGIMGASP
jgi:hypothetical protein